MTAMKRGSNVALTREIPNLRGVVLGVALATSEPVLAQNVVVATVLCDSSSRAVSNDHFVFFNQLSSPDLSVSKLQQVVGADTEQVEVDLPDVPADVERIVVVSYLNEGVVANRSLGQLREVVIRVLNLDGNTELVRSENLATALTSETAVVLGELYRHGGDWKFKVIGQGYNTGLAGVASDYGVVL